MSDTSDNEVSQLKQVRQASVGGSTGIILGAVIGYSVYPNPMVILVATLGGVAFLGIAIGVMA